MVWGIVNNGLVVIIVGLKSETADWGELLIKGDTPCCDKLCDLCWMKCNGSKTKTMIVSMSSTMNP